MPRFTPIIIAVAIALGLLLFLTFGQFLASSYIPNLNRWLGSFIAWAPVVLIFILGGQVGQVGVLSFVGISLIIASVRGDSGCEVMTIPGLIFKQHIQLACLLFSPIDWLEAKFYAYLKKSA